MTARPPEEGWTPEEAAAARGVLRTPVEPLDEVTRRRLLRGAMAEARPAAPARAPRTRPFLLMTAAAAAAVVAVLALVPVLRDGDGGGDDGPPLARGGNDELEESFLGDLGRVGDVEAVGTAFADPAAAPSLDRSADLPPEVARCSGRLSRGRPLEASASLTFGSPGERSVALQFGDVVVVAAADEDCRVLDRVELAPS